MSVAGPPKKQQRTLMVVLGILLVVLIVVAIQLAGTQPSVPDSASSGTPAIGGDFSLIDQDGTRVDQSILEGRVSLIYFGFTYCPDICPTELAKMGVAYDLLDESDRDLGNLQSILVSVDPERDTPAVLARYLESEAFPPNMIGLTGTLDEVQGAADAYRVYFKKEADPASADGYTMAHSSIIYLMGRDGLLRQFFTIDSIPGEIANAVSAVLAEG